MLVGTKTRTRVGTRVASFVAVRAAERLSGVGLRKGVRVLEGVMVTDAVRVGVAEIKGVAVGVEEGVLVGSVEVGNGPSSASAVWAMAVLVAAACFWEGPPRPEAVISPNVTA